MDRIRILIPKDHRQYQIEEKNSNLYGLDSNLNSREFAQTTRFQSPLYRFESLSEEEVETKAKDSNSCKKDSISFWRTLKHKWKMKKSDSNLPYKDSNPGFGELKNVWRIQILVRRIQIHFTKLNCWLKIRHKDSNPRVSDSNPLLAVNSNFAKEIQILKRRIRIPLFVKALNAWSERPATPNFKSNLSHNGKSFQRTLLVVKV